MHRLHRQGQALLVRHHRRGNRGLTADLRPAYEAEVRALADQAAAGGDPETLARRLSAARNALKRKYRDLGPADARLRAERWSLERYGAVEGPTPDQLRAQGRSWDEIIAAACRPGEPA